MTDRWASRIVLIGVLSALLVPSARAEPVRPSDDSLVLATVKAGAAGGSSEMHEAKADLARDPGNPDAAIRLARLAIDQGRATSDPRLYGQAQAALRRWWTDAAPPEPIRVLRAVIRQALHDFPGALADLDAILARSPRNPQARLSRAFVRLVVGDPAGAAADCRALPANLPILTTATCRARVEALTGSATQGFERLAGALDLDRNAGEAMRRFGIAVLADIAAGLGRTADADLFFADAARTGAPDVPLLAATADHLLDTGRPADVMALLDGKGESDAVILRLAIAAARVGDPRLARWSEIMKERFAAAASGGVRLHLREEARFRLEVERDFKAALPLAAQNWAVQKELADARLLLDCAIAAGEPEAAADVLRFMRETGLTDARLTPPLRELGEL